MYVQKITDFSLSAFDGRRCYLSGNESTPSNRFSMFSEKCNCMKLCSSIDTIFRLILYENDLSSKFFF